MNNNNKKLFIIIISLALVVITGTFAWLSWRSQNTAMVLTIGDIRGVTITLKPYQINRSLSPVASYTDGVVVDVTTTNAKNEPDGFKLYYKIDTIDDSLKDEGFKYTITKCTANCENNNNYSVINDAGGNFIGTSSNSELEIYRETIPANTTYKYKVYLWIDSASGNQSNMQNKSFIGELRANAFETLYSMMKNKAIIDNVASTYVSSSTGIDWYAGSSDTNGKGIYLRAGTENDIYPIYYYRGKIDNNFVLFGGFCWKIIRTTNTGGIKLFYDGLPIGDNNDQCYDTANGTFEGTVPDIRFTSYPKYNLNVNSAADVGYMYGAAYNSSYKNSSALVTSYLYGNSFSYSNGTYTLIDTIASTGDWSVDYNTLSNNHYTCFNTTGTCSSLYYIYYTEESKAFYTTMAVGKTIDVMFDEMLKNSTNEHDSTMKTFLEEWYSNNLISYASQIEDTPWCNDRRIHYLSGWNPNGGDPTNFSVFEVKYRLMSGVEPVLTCEPNDSFTVNSNNGNGKLTYPIGLPTMDEAKLAGIGTPENGIKFTEHYLNIKYNWITMSPLRDQQMYLFYSDSTIHTYGTHVSAGTVPMISLKHEVKYLRGTGIATDPYVVE